MTTNEQVHKNSLYILAENKLGVLEKIVGTFTVRGYLPSNIVYTPSKNPDFADVKITVACTDLELEKIVKILHNNINILEICLILAENNKMCSSSTIVKAS